MSESADQKTKNSITSFEHGCELIEKGVINGFECYISFSKEYHPLGALYRMCTGLGIQALFRCSWCRPMAKATTITKIAMNPGRMRMAVLCDLSGLHGGVAGR